MDQSKMTFLQNVLRYSTSHTTTTTTTTEAPSSSTQNDSSSGVGESVAAEAKVREMSPERRKWLENALDNMTVNPIEEMKKCISYLSSSSEKQEDVEKQVTALETLRDWCEDMNFAIDFHKLTDPQYKLVVSLLNHERAEIRALACDLIATLAQNNPDCQQTLLDAKLMPLVLHKLGKTDEPDEVRVKALYALSCMCRDFEPAQERLVETTANGVDTLIRVLEEPAACEKLKLKCCFLLTSLMSASSSSSSMSSGSRVKQLLTDKRLIRTLIGLYRRDDLSIHEHVLAAINILVDENPRAVAQALEMNDNVDFKKILNERMRAIADDPRHDEEREMAKSILDKYFRN